MRMYICTIPAITSTSIYSELLTFVCACIQGNQMLKVFNISNNGFSNDGVIATAKSLEVNSSLLELDISYVCPSVCLSVCLSVYISVT